MSSSAKKHEVFLSFRGDDTREGFTSHLFNALSQKSIKTYIDYQLNRGDDVWPALATAVEDSHVSIVVFSENYATSKWCLEELVKILECRKNQGQVVIPVFYKTDPSHVRKQTGSYKNAFAKHEPDLGDKDSESNKQKVLKWKAALTEAANISGWDSRTHESESQLIGNVVNDVLQKVHLRYPIELKGLVGTERNSRNVELLMKKVRVIGIWGMGGIGKSTIAKVLFAKLFPHYDNVCFVANAKEYSLDKLLFELLKEEAASKSLGGSTFDMRRLSSKKVLVVLDNVESLDQLEYLCREYGELSYDSRLIITTRYRQLLIGRVDWIYKVKKWKTAESLKLFSLEAFKQNHPQKGYEDLSQEAVDYAGGVPLALKVLGSYLRFKNTDFWRSTFRKLNMYPNETIQKLLQVSYDGLDHLERKIFLDIAVFFKGKKKDHVIKILDACGFEASSGIEVLEDKALITVSNSNRIQMHDLLQKMGLEIVRREFSSNPERRTRLRDGEARGVIEEDKGTDSIEGITMDLSQIKNLPLHADTFTKMKTLRFLRFYTPLGKSSGTTYLDLPTVLEPFSDKLRYFEWIGYPFESLPPTFCAKLLVEIRLPHSNVKELWQGIQELDKLEGIDLSECKQFVSLPNLSMASRLKWVNLSGCESLCDLHPSVLSSDSLVTLILDRCTNLRSVKGEKHLKSLEKISVSGCLSLEEFAVSSDLIENLDLSNTGIQTLDTSIGRMHNLKWLNLEGLRLGHLLKELSCLTSLKELKLSNNRGLVIDKQQLHVLFDGLRSLKILHLKECSNSFELPDNINVLSELQELRLDGSNVNRLPESIKQLEGLEILSLENCMELQCLPELPPFIKILCAVNCTSLVSVSNLKTLATKMMGKAKNISFKNSLNLDGHSLNGIMESLHLTMVSAAFHNVLVRRLGVAVHSYNYTSVEFCVPGRRVPRQVKYRTTESSITIKLPNRSDLLGFIYSVVLSPTGGMKKHGTKIKCQCHLAEGTMATLLNTDITELNFDHVCVWYDPFHCDSILKFFEPKVCFEFHVENDTGEVDGSICIKECGVRLISVSELHSVLPELDLDSDKKKDLEKGVELESGRTITLTSIETSSDELESNDTRSQSEESSSDSIDKSDSELVEPEAAKEGNGRKDHYSNVEESIKSIQKETNTSAEKESDSELVEPEPAKEGKGRKDHYSNVEESIKSIQKETNTSAGKGPRENTTNPKKVTEPKSVVVKLESVEEDNESEGHFLNVEKSMGSTSKETNSNAGTSHEENITNSTKVARKALRALKGIVKFQAIIRGRAVRHQSMSTLSLQSILKSKGNEGTPTESDAGSVVSVVEEQASEGKSSENNYDWQDNFEETKQSEENPNLQGGQIIAPDANDLIIKESDREIENAPVDLGKPKGEEDDGSDEDPFAELESILLGSPESSPKATFSTSDVAIREALLNLECLLENSLESILGDIELQRQLHVSLECIKQASHVEVSPNVAKLVESMTSSTEDLFNDFASTKKVVEDHIGRLEQREKLMQQVSDAKKQKESMKKEKSRFEDEAERLEEEGKKLDEKIRVLVEQKKILELEKAKLKESMERCEGEKKKLEEEAKNMRTESKELMSAIKNSKSSYAAALSKQQKLNDKWEGFRTAFADNMRK